MDFKQIRFSKSSCFSGLTLHVMDFSYMTPYIDFKTGKQLKKAKVDEEFRVNNEFQTLNRFQKLRTDPRDDLEMTCHFMHWLNNNQQMLDLKYPSQTINNPELRNLFMLEYKKSYTLDCMCKHLKKKEHSLYNFCQEVNGLRYGVSPDYNRLRSILRSNLNYEM